MTVEQVSELIAMHEQGAPIDELAETLGIHRTTVMMHLHRAGAERRTGLVQRHLKEARSLYESGSSLARVAAHYNVDAETVHRAFKNAGLSLRPRRGWHY